MLIYCYADILGYRDLLKRYNAIEIYNILNEAFSEMHTVLQAYTKREDVKKNYEEGIHFGDDYRFFDLFFSEGAKEKIDLYKSDVACQVSNLHIKTYLAFDTIVIYWEEYQNTPYHTELFTLAIDIVYLLLYMKGIIIRGTIGICEEYYLGKENNYFIVKNIDCAAEIEKMQNWGNILIFGKELLQQYVQFDALVEDFYARMQYNQDHIKHFEFVPFKKDKGKRYDRLVLDGKTAVHAEDLFDNMFLTTICPINNFCLSYYGSSFFQQLYDKTESTLREGKSDHPSELRYWTARFLNGRIKRCIYNNRFLKRLGDNSFNPLWEEIIT